MPLVSFRKKICLLVSYFVVLGGHYPLFDEKEKIFTVISSLEKFII